MQLRLPHAWTVATGVGFAVAFPVFLLFNQTALWGFRTALDVLFVMPDPGPIVDDPNRQIPTALQAARDPFYLGGFVVFGLAVSAAQLAVLRQRVRAAAWLATGGLGFLGVGLALLWPLSAVRAGNIPGPVEPFTIVLLGGGLTGILQSQYLRRRGLLRGAWVGRWLLGLVIGCGASLAVFLALGVLGLLLPGLNPRWGGTMAIFGLVVGLAAGAATSSRNGEVLRSGSSAAA
jgi:hypothetical protein